MVISLKKKQTNKYKEKFVILQSIGIIGIKSKETRVIIYTCRYSSGHLIPRISAGVDDHPSFLTFFITTVWSLSTVKLGLIKPVFHLFTGKLLPEDWFLFWVENHAESLSTDFEPGFPSRVYCCLTTEKHQSRPVRLTGNAYLVWKVGQSNPGALLEELIQ